MEPLDLSLVQTVDLVDEICKRMDAKELLYFLVMPSSNGMDLHVIYPMDADIDDLLEVYEEAKDILLDQDCEEGATPDL